jgi:hypothetical protein
LSSIRNNVPLPSSSSSSPFVQKRAHFCSSITCLIRTTQRRNKSRAYKATASDALYQNIMLSKNSNSNNIEPRPRRRDASAMHARMHDDGSGSLIILRIFA